MFGLEKFKDNDSGLKENYSLARHTMYFASLRDPTQVQESSGRNRMDFCFFIKCPGFFNFLFLSFIHHARLHISFSFTLNFSGLGRYGEQKVLPTVSFFFIWLSKYKAIWDFYRYFGGALFLLWLSQINFFPCRQEFIPHSTDFHRTRDANASNRENREFFSYFSSIEWTEN